MINWGPRLKWKSPYLAGGVHTQCDIITRPDNSYLGAPYKRSANETSKMDPRRGGASGEKRLPPVTCPPGQGAIQISGVRLGGARNPFQLCNLSFLVFFFKLISYWLRFLVTFSFHWLLTSISNEPTVWVQHNFKPTVWVQHNFTNQCVIWNHHCNSPEQHLKYLPSY